MVHSNGKGSARIDTAVYIPHFLSILNNRLSSGASDTYLRLFGIGINEWRVLSVLIKSPGCIASYVAETVGVHKGMVSRSLRVLEDGGFLRIDASPAQRAIHLTASGIRLHDRIAKLALKREQILVEGLSEQDLATLRSLLRHLINNVPAVNAYDPTEDGLSSEDLLPASSGAADGPT